jgi:hypothetical protein
MNEPIALPVPPYDTRTRWQLPGTIGPFAFAEHRVHTPEEHGVSYLYRLGDGHAVGTIYVYDFGIRDLPDDVKNERVLKAFAEVLQGVVQSCSTPSRRLIDMPKGAELRSNTETGREFLFNHHMIMDHGRQTGSVATLTTFNRHFMKIRLSYDAVQPFAQQMSEVFVYGVHHLLFTSQCAGANGGAQ